MKLRDLREFLAGIPEHLDDSEISFREIVVDDDKLYALDKPIFTVEIDADGEEMILLTEDNDKKQQEYRAKWTTEQT